MKTRNFGLDVLRATAILFVLFNHILNYFITFHRSTIWGDYVGILGVEIFFVLSGFLIGRILLTSFRKDMPKGTIKHFYIRRWFRTLPLYYFLLIIFVSTAVIQSQQPDFHLLHFFFLQNFVPESLNFFSVSWSLAIEEWFYLLIPLILYFGLQHKLLTKRIMIFLLILIVCVACMRYVYVSVFDPTFDDVRKHIFLRFDSLLIGVLLAGIKLHMNTIYKHLQNPVFPIIGIIGICMMGYIFSIFFERGFLNISWPARVLSFPFLSGLIALLLPFLETSLLVNTHLWKVRGLREIIVWTSFLSYSLYLIHLTVFEGVKQTFTDILDPLVMLPIALGGSVIIAYYLYHYIEKPFMQLRERFAEK